MDNSDDPMQGRELVFATPWFKVLAEHPPGGGKPHYAIEGQNFVVVVAVTTKGQLLLVRQYRNAVRRITLELPSGHIDPGETPEQAARRELFEETAHEPAVFESLGMLSPTVARYTTHMWCFFAGGVKPVPGAQIQPGEVVELVFYEGGLRKLIEEKGFYSAPSYAALCLAIVRGLLPLS